MKNSIVVKAERMAEDFLQDSIQNSYQIVDKGIVNQVCVVETKGRKIVVRMNDKQTYSSFVKEKWCIEQAQLVGIPSPEVLSMGIIDDTAYMIQTFIEGENGSDSTKPKLDIWKQLGVYAKQMQKIPVSGYGEDLFDSFHGVFKSPPHPGSDGSWNGYVNYNSNSLTENDQLIELGVINWTESKRIRKLFEGLKDENFHFGLIHGDLSLKNTIVNHEGKIILIDWGNAEVFVAPHGELFSLLNTQLLDLGPNNEEFQAFLDGYDASEEELSCLNSVLLLSAFDKLRWAIDRSPNDIQHFAMLARQMVDRTLTK